MAGGGEAWELGEGSLPSLSLQQGLHDTIYQIIFSTGTSSKRESPTCLFVGRRSLRCLVQDEILEEVGSFLQGGNTNGVNLTVLRPEQRLNLRVGTQV